MSLEQIFKVILGVTTARRSFAGLMMVCGVVLSLRFFDPKLKTFIPNATEVSSLLSFLTGTFAGYLFYSAILKCYLYALAWRKERIEKHQELTRIANEKKQSDLKIQDSLSRFKSTYTHLDELEIDTIRLLTDKDGHPLRSDNYTLKQLNRNHWVWKISELSATEGVYKVHGYIAKYVIEQWDAEIKENVNKFYNLENPLKDLMLNLLKKGNDDTVFDYNFHSFYNHKSDFPKIFIFKLDNRGGSIKFEPRYKEALEEQYSLVFKDSLYVRFV
ncbi:TPA: hypothetical protein I9Y28_002504 [Citrobacter freundii]|nr:hypothetical protein [Citrobacter freundii]